MSPYSFSANKDQYLEYLEYLKEDLAKPQDDRFYITTLSTDYCRIVEIGWKLMKYILEELCYIEYLSSSPREIVKEARSAGLIEVDQYPTIKKYLPILEEFAATLTSNKLEELEKQE